MTSAWLIASSASGAPRLPGVPTNRAWLFGTASLWPYEGTSAAPSSSASATASVVASESTTPPPASRSGRSALDSTSAARRIASGSPGARKSVGR